MRLRSSALARPCALALLAALAAVSCKGDAQNSRRPARIDGRPNLNGVWEALNTAYWNLEGGTAQAIPAAWKLGALFAVPPGPSVVEGSTIPYLPAALAQRDKNRETWPGSDPETKCYRAGIPRSTYLPYPFQIVQGDGDIMFVYSYATSNRTVKMKDHLDPDQVLVEQWNGWANGRWEGDTLVIDVFGQIRDTWFDRAGNFHGPDLKVTERYTPIDDSHLLYEATIDDPSTFSRPWKISMPLYKRVESNVEVFEYKCVEFAETLMYGDLLKNPIK
jgi:hypothetical protein